MNYVLFSGYMDRAKWSRGSVRREDRKIYIIKTLKISNNSNNIKVDFQVSFQVGKDCFGAYNP
jgi:hypothetical protein